MPKRPLSLKLIVLYKATLGLVEVVFGLVFMGLAFGVQSRVVNSLVQRMVTNELNEDPNDFFAHWVVTHNLPASLHAVFTPSVVVLTLGVVKLFIAYSIWQNSRRLHAITLVLVAGLGVAGLVSTIHAFSWFKVVATSIDALLLYYLAWVLPKQFPLDSAPASG